MERAHVVMITDVVKIQWAYLKAELLEKPPSWGRCHPLRHVTLLLASDRDPLKIARKTGTSITQPRSESQP